MTNEKFMLSYEDIEAFRQREITFNQEGLSKGEQSLVKDVALRLFGGAEKRFKHALSRCTFFAEPGYEELVQIVSEEKELKNPEIRGCDENPFDQHYWVEAELKKGSRRVIFDPIFGYVGLFDKVKNDFYYKNSRKVVPHKPPYEGGVRVKTIGI